MISHSSSSIAFLTVLALLCGVDSAPVSYTSLGGLLNLFKATSKSEKGIKAATKGAKSGADQNGNSNSNSGNNGKKTQVVAMPMGIATRENEGSMALEDRSGLVQTQEEYQVSGDLSNASNADSESPNPSL
ncbi:hypothetical protein HHX47_DHR3000382 [Lentinula edodes]|nr:hypothetical protein HHX47_DHR3000382 [Lentinula edodes]